MEQLDIFEVLDDIAVERGRNTFKKDVMLLIEKRLAEMNILEYFDLDDTKVFLRTCANNEIIFMRLLSSSSYLNEVRLYPPAPEFYKRYVEHRFSLVNENGEFKDGNWMHCRRIIVNCNFRENWLYDGFYLTAAERSIEGILKTGFWEDVDNV